MVARKVKASLPKSNVERGKSILTIDSTWMKKTPPRNTPMKKSSLLLAGLVLSVLTLAFGTNHGFNEVFGPLFHPAPGVPPLAGPRHGLDSLHRWNVIAINASGLDHTPVTPGENRVFGEQLGPGRASRAM